MRLASKHFEDRTSSIDITGWAVDDLGAVSEYQHAANVNANTELEFHTRHRCGNLLVSSLPRANLRMYNLGELTASVPLRCGVHLFHELPPKASSTLHVLSWKQRTVSRNSGMMFSLCVILSSIDRHILRLAHELVWHIELRYMFFQQRL